MTLPNMMPTKGNHHHVLELDALDEPDKGPGAQSGHHKGEDAPGSTGWSWA